MFKIQLIKSKEDCEKNMKRIKIKKFDMINYNKGFLYINNRPLFDLCYISDKTKNEMSSCSKFSSCRAYLTDMLRTIIIGKRNSDDGHSYYIKKSRPLKLNDVILGIEYNTEINHITSIINVINYYSDIGNLPKLKLIGFSEEEKSKLWFIKIPMKYKEKSFLMSMTTLLIRVLLCVENEEIEKLKNIDDVEKYFYKYRKHNDFTSTDSSDLYRNNNYLKLRILMQKHKKLFYGLGNKKLFPYEVGYSFHDKSGINSLCTSITLNKVLNTRAKKMLKVKRVTKNRS